MCYQTDIMLHLVKLLELNRHPSRYFTYDEPTWLLDVSAMVCYMIPHRTQRKWIATVRRCFLMTILGREDNDLQRTFLDACTHGNLDALKKVLKQHQGRKEDFLQCCHTILTQPLIHLFLQFSGALVKVVIERT